MISFFRLAVVLAAFVPALGSAQIAGNSDSAVIVRILDSARVLGLPQTPLRSLLQEGRQRNQSTARIAVALRRYYDALIVSRSTLGARSTEAEIDAGASVILSGAEAKSLRAVRAARPNANVTVALVVLADLVDRGVPLIRAEDAVVTLAHAGTSDAAFNDFRTGVQQDLASGQGAESSLLRRTRETVSRLQIVVPPKPPPLELEYARVVATGSRAPALRQEANALAAEPRLPQRAFWDLGLRATPVRALASLQIRSVVAGTFDRAGDTGQTNGELLVVIGARRPLSGAELGLGATVSTGLSPRLPMAYSAVWFTPAGTTIRLEGRLAPARELGAGGATPMDPLQSFGQIAFQTSDTLPAPPGGGGTPPPPTPDSGALRPANTLGRIGELRMNVSRALLGLTFDAATGVRFLDAKPLDTWSTGSLAARAHSNVSIVAGVATRRPIQDTALPQHTNVFLGLRLQRAARAKPDVVTDRASPRDETVPRAFLRIDDGAMHLEVVAVSAQFVEVSGDFTDWETVPMVASRDHRWRLALPDSRSMVRFRVRIDAGAWLVPAGIARARDAFGDEVGVVVLPLAGTP